MQNGSIFINEKITRTEKFSPYPPKFGNKYYVTLNGFPSAWEFPCWHFFWSDYSLFEFCQQICLYSFLWIVIICPTFFFLSFPHSPYTKHRLSIYIIPSIFRCQTCVHVLYTIYIKTNLKFTMSINIRTEGKKTIYTLIGIFSSLT